jgi:hypothetical protein
MKRLNKVQINPEKVMKNEELVRLRGGYDPCTCLCWRETEILGYLVSETGSCPKDCAYAFGDGATGSCQC